MSSCWCPTDLSICFDDYPPSQSAILKNKSAVNYKVRVMGQYNCITNKTTSP
jgi:hypothetical protein